MPKGSLRPKNSKVSHGDPACAEYGCKREECLKSRRQADKVRRYQFHKGNPGLVSGSRARSHIIRLRIANMSDQDIVDASGVCQKTISNACRLGSTIHRDTEKKILSIPVPQAKGITKGGSRFDGKSTLLRLRALVVKGFPRSLIAKEMTGNYSKQALAFLMARLGDPGSGDRSVRLPTAQKVQILYEKLWNKDPSNYGVPQHIIERCVEEGKSKRWCPPAALDDDLLDDPAKGRMFPVGDKRTIRSMTLIYYK